MKARAWLEEAVAAAPDGAVLTLMPMVQASFLRLVASPRIFVQPTPTADAVAFVDGLLAAPGIEQAGLGTEWPVLRRMCLDQRLGGNAVPEAWLAAAVVQQAEYLVSFDRDFRKLLPRSRLTLLEPAQQPCTLDVEPEGAGGRAREAGRHAGRAARRISAWMRAAWQLPLLRTRQG